MKLFEIADEIERILAREVDPETGEITDATLAALDQLEMAKDAKILAVLAYAKGELAEATAVKVHADALKRRAAGHQARYDRLVEYATGYAEQGRVYSDGRVRLRWRKSTRVVLADEETLTGVPEEFVRTKIERSADRVKIGEMLKSGETVEWAALETRHNPQVD